MFSHLGVHTRLLHVVVNHVGAFMEQLAGELRSQLPAHIGALVRYRERAWDDPRGACVSCKQDARERLEMNFLCCARGLAWHNSCQGEQRFADSSALSKRLSALGLSNLEKLVSQFAAGDGALPDDVRESMSNPLIDSAMRILPDVNEIRLCKCCLMVVVGGDCGGDAWPADLSHVHLNKT